ncbi:hypothetical protein NW762_013173 [Fusarium torreyae]|uniref:Zn(2)-C6 fungal-type domain-containing protein n=1 Tax=Fusarium torreyae TaxID=1237075 RepID=A0A9W8VAN6_9HYPO|nr:hypothetical protein NW762_013173 [Fusarium torreyae]
MGFTGEPSTACQPCREKRRKCDHAQPGCSQCARQNIQCPGYRTAWELRFRDQTTSIAQGPRKKKSTQVEKPQLPSQSFRGNPATLGSPPRVIDNQTFDSAVSYFMVTYLDATAYGSYLPQLYVEVILQQPAQGALFTAIRATSLAALAKRHQSQDMMGTALKEFSAALIQTNAGLANSKDALLNTTLGAVLTLGLFESIVSNGQHNIKNWITHTLGTIALLRLRGVQQFKDILGRRMCIHAAYNIRVSCLNRAVEVPEDLLKLENEWYQAFDFPKPVRDHCSIMNKVCSIKADMRNNPTPEVIHRALDTEEEAEALIQAFSMPDSKGKGDVHNKSSKSSIRTAINGSNSINSDAGSPVLVMMARWLYGMSMLRLVMIEIMWDGASTISCQSEIIHKLGSLNNNSLNDESAEGCQARLNTYANRKVAQIAKMILAFAPRFLDASDPNSRYPRMARCMILPLAFVQSSTCCPPEIRKEALELLDILEKDIELSQAEHAAKIIYGSRLAGDW